MSAPAAVLDQLGALPPARRRLMVELLRARGVADDDLPIVPRDPAAARVPLSFPQLRLWFLDQVDPGASRFTLTYGLRLGAVAPGELRAAFEEVVRRHEILRTSIRVADGEPVQEVADTCEVPLAPPLDLRGRPANEVAEAVGRVKRELRHTRIDLARPPLLRLAPVLHDEGLTLVLALPHLVFDGWSCGLLARELRAALARVDGETPPLPELPLQYADFAAWQRAPSRQREMDRLLAYWRGRGLERPVPELPGAREHAPGAEAGHGFVQRRVDGAAHAAIHAWSRARGQSLFTTLLTAVTLLVQRHTGADSVPVGVVDNGRTRPELNDLIGFFADVLVMRTEVSPRQTLDEVAATVRETVDGAMAHRGLPFDWLVAGVGPGAGGPRAGRPLFQVAINMLGERIGLRVRRGAGGDLAEEGETAGGRFELGFCFFDGAGELMLQLSHDAARYDRATAGSYLDDLVAILARLCDGGARRVRELAPPSWSAAPPPLRLARPGGEGVEEREVRTLHARFLEVAARTPGAIAVEAGGEALTYAALALRARRAATAIAARVPARDAPARVAICLPAGVAWSVAILGTLLAGHAYVPLDPAAPGDRNAFVLDDAAVSLVIGEGGAFGAVPVLTPADLAAAGPCGVSTAADPDGIAYVIYTSGSSGRPKGTTQTHRTVQRMIATYAGGLAITPDDRLTMISAPAFSAAVMDLFGALLTGAVLLPFDLSRATLAELAGWLAESRATVYHSVPTVLRALLGALPPGLELPHLRVVDLGGEQVLRADVRAFQRRFPRGVALVNGYGCTELNVLRQWVADAATPLRDSLAPVGYGVPGVEIRIVDDQGELCGPHEEGEIVIVSDALTPGYWRRPEADAIAFGTTPDGRRLYRTGDVGRIAPDGALTHLGRRDQQLKIRGVRVEPAELEEALLRCDGVADAAVGTFRPGDAGEVELVAYVVPRRGETLERRQLLAGLRALVPGYLLPRHVIPLPALPRTPTNKLDRRALPPPDDRRETGNFTAPRTETERGIARAWSALLRTAAVGIDDDFFELGGNSLLLLRVLEELRGEHPRITLRHALEHRTIRGLSVALGDLATA